MDIVYIRDLKLNARIGIFEWEKCIEQKIRIDLEMAWDNRVAAASDDIQHTLNYKTVSERVMSLVAGQHYELVERLAEEIASTLRQEFQIPWLRVTVGKPGAIREAAEVGVRIERGQLVAG